MTRRFFDDTTVETAMRSSIEYKYTTINNFDETIDDIKLDNNIVIMTIKTTTVSLRSTIIWSSRSLILLHIITASASLGYIVNVKRLARPEEQ